MYDGSCHPGSVNALVACGSQPAVPPQLLGRLAGRRLVPCALCTARQIWATLAHKALVPPLCAQPHPLVRAAPAPLLKMYIHQKYLRHSVFGKVGTCSCTKPLCHFLAPSHARFATCSSRCHAESRSRSEVQAVLPGRFGSGLRMRSLCQHLLSRNSHLSVLQQQLVLTSQTL